MSPTVAWTLAALALLIAALLRPWRLLTEGPEHLPLLTPLLATLVVLPWLWAMPALHHSPFQLRWSGACLVLLMLGWPLAVPTLLLSAAITVWVAPITPDQAVVIALWQGLVPATLALALGAVLRRFVAHHPFVYILGRAFLGTALCMFAAGLLAQWAGQPLIGVSAELIIVAHWLLAWSDAFVTGMLCAIFVAFRPQWLATWSDRLYIPKP